MNKNITLIIGLLLLAAGVFGVYMLFCEHVSVDMSDQQGSVETVVPVRAGKIVRTDLHGFEVVYGRVKALPVIDNPGSDAVVVKCAVNGVITSIKCSPGKMVKKGDVLFELDVRIAGAKLKEKQQALDFLRRELTRQQSLLKIKAVSQIQYQSTLLDFNQAQQALDIARLQLGYYIIRAPISGRIVSVKISPAQTVEMSDVLAEILNTRCLCVSVHVPAGSIEKIHIGQSVQVFTNDLSQKGKWRAIGKVNYIDARVDLVSNSVEVRADVLPDLKLHSGQFIKARILYQSHTDTLAVPVSALVSQDNGACIYGISDNHAVRISVVKKIRQGDLIEIAGRGLSEGMDIVTQGAYGLPENTMIKIIGHDQ